VIFRTWWRDLCVFGMCAMKSPDNEPEAMTGLANELCHSGSDTGEAASLFAANEFLVTRPSRLVAAEVARPAPPGCALRALTGSA
jgi:hypothetical protein